MKTKLWMMSALVALAAAAALQSCNDDDDNRNLAYPNALVTLKTNASGTFFLQLDDSTTVIPTNMKASPYGKKEVRALANINMDAKEPKDHVKSGYVNWLDSILTKNMAPNLGDKNDATYGNDPVELVKDWTTLVEDGYLTLRFRTYFGYGKRHVLNLIPTGKPYEVELRHNAQGDDRRVVRDGLVAFRLIGLPDTGEGRGTDREMEVVQRREERKIQVPHPQVGRNGRGGSAYSL